MSVSVSVSLNIKHLPPRAATVRVINKDNEPWFVAKDVCDVLGFRDAFNGTRTLDEKGTHFMSTLGGTQRVSIVNENSYLARTEVGLPAGKPMVIVNESGHHE